MKARINESYVNFAAFLILIFCVAFMSNLWSSRAGPAPEPILMRPALDEFIPPYQEPSTLAYPQEDGEDGCGEVCARICWKSEEGCLRD